MNILVCFKVVPDLDMLSGSDWSSVSHFQVDTSFVKTMINPYDESALELVLKLKDGAAKDHVAVIVTAFTIGTSPADKVLKNLFALKYHHGVRVECDRDLRFNAPMVSKIIHYYCKNIKNQQIIILGQQSNVGDNAKTPLLVAERLGIPCISSVTGIKLSPHKDCLAVTSRIDDLVIEQTIKPPVVLVIGNVPNSYIRVPTLKDKMQYGKKEIEVYTLGQLGLQETELDEENDMELIELFYEKNEKSCVFIQGENSFKKAKVLYEDYLREKVKL